MVFISVEVNKTADKEIEFAVPVVVKPDGSGSPPRCSDSSFGGYIRESAVAIIVVQNAAAILRDVEVRNAIAIIVTNGHAHSVATTRDARLFSDVGESSVAIIVIQCIAQRACWGIEVTWAAIDQVNVHPSVVVIIEESAARA